MSHGNHSTAATNGVDKAYENNDLPPRRPAEPTVVEVRTSISRQGWLQSLLTKLSCRSSRSMSNSIHFHAQRIQDSVHVMLKHDKDACKRRGQPVKGYSPREPLPVRLAAARIEASEDD